jgi:hypothetical protein
MTKHLERTLDHAITLIRDLVATENVNPIAQRKLREATALLHAVADAVELARTVDDKPQAALLRLPVALPLQLRYVAGVPR